MFGIAAFWFRADAWLAFFTVNAFSHLFALLHWHPGMAFFLSFIPSTTFFLLIMFPNGRLAPRWSCLLVLLPLPGNILDHLIQLRIINQDHFTYLLGDVFPRFLLISVPLTIGIILLIRHGDTLTQDFRQQIKWVIIGLAVSSTPYWLWIIFRYPYPRIHALSPGSFMIEGQFTKWLYILYQHASPISALMVLGVVLYRYFRLFTFRERQQMKWIAFILLLFAGPLFVSYIFAQYYSIHTQYENSFDLAYLVDRLFMLALWGIAISISLALFRYHLHDIDLFINHAFVFSGLCIVMGTVGVSCVSLHDFAFNQLSENQNKLFTTIVFVISATTLFNPFRIKLKEFANEHFKPETTTI